MRTSKEIADEIVYHLKDGNDIEFWSIYDLFEDINLLPPEKKLINNVIEILTFYGALTFDRKLGCWRNNYYGLNDRGKFIPILSVIVMLIPFVIWGCCPACVVVNPLTAPIYYFIAVSLLAILVKLRIGWAKRLLDKLKKKRDINEKE